MAIDICLESYGLVVQMIDTGWVDQLSGLVPSRDRFSWSKTPVQSLDQAQADEVKGAAEELSYQQANALWLVDVCGCSYDEAAAEMQIDRPQLVRCVSGGRTQIRSKLSD